MVWDGCLRFLDDEGRVYPYSSLLEFDTQRCEPAFHVDDYWLPAHTIPAERRPNGWIRIFRSDLKAAIGNTMVFGAARRLNPGITVSDSQGIATVSYTHLDASFIFEGLVVGNDPRTHSITLRPLDPERFEIRSGEPWFTGYDWASPFGENILFDPGTRCV